MNPQEFETSALAKLRVANERLTGTRRQVLRVLAYAERPLTHGDVVRRLIEAGSGGDKNTTSRALALFEEHGIVVRTQSGLVPFSGADASATMTTRGPEGIRIRSLPEHIAGMLRAEAPGSEVSVIRVEMGLRGGEAREEIDVGER